MREESEPKCHLVDSASADPYLPLGSEMTYAIVVHGGAGFHANGDEPRIKAALNRSATVGLASTASERILTTL